MPINRGELQDAFQSAFDSAAFQRLLVEVGRSWENYAGPMMTYPQVIERVVDRAIREAWLDDLLAAAGKSEARRNPALVAVIRVHSLEKPSRPADPSRPAPSRPTVVLRFRLVPAGETISVRFAASVVADQPGPSPGPVDPVLPDTPTASADGVFEADLGTDRLSRMLDRIQANRAKRDDLRDVGAQLWTGLLSNEISRSIKAIRAHWKDRRPFYQVRLALPVTLDHLPWEALYDERQVGFLSESADYCIIHDPPNDLSWPGFASGGAQSIEVLVAVPEGSGLDVGAELRSVDAEVARAAGSGARLHALKGRVTPGQLSRALREGRRDVVQFIGHGGVDAEGRVRLRFNAESGGDDTQDLDLEALAATFANRDVRLCVFNSCFTASGFADPSLRGAGPLLTRVGVPAVIAMRYAVADHDALRFSSEFYRELVNTGRIDLAVAWARQQVSLSATEGRVQGFVAPVFYLADGVPRMFHPTRPDVTPAPVARVVPSTQVPDDLVLAIRENRCVPILGPGLLRASVVRQQACPPGPKELADILKEKFGYPDDADFKASDVADWIDIYLLQRVCQHSMSGRPAHQVLKTIADVYRSQRPPAALDRLAGWSVPGIVCTFFDDLMWQALSARARPPRVLNRVNEPVEVDEGRTVLVNLRGSITDSKSLVLTEDDHDALWDDMASLSPAVKNLVYREVGRTLLIVGVNPRDQTVRQFIRRLLPDRRPRTMGDIYWVVPRRTGADDVYWNPRYGVHWIEEPVDRFIEATTEQATAVES